MSSTKTLAPRTLTVGANTYPVMLPNIRDSRLHVAFVIVTIHFLGQVSLGFHISVPQILAAILTCAIIEVALTFRSRKAFVWPASAMLTGSGVALILRVPSTPVDDHWTMHKWYVFAGVAAFSLATKYLIRYRGSHLFNPSNIGLVIAFLVLGSARVEPLDFWWAPFEGAMILAYAVIITGGVVITHRLGLLPTVATFWLGLAAGVGVIAASGHCMIARWAFSPVCGFDYWRVIVTSPEVLIFMFFMITDPKTLPAGRVGRVVFGLLVAATSTLLMAPQTDEFGTKVALLAGLVIVCAFRPLIDRLAPAPRSALDDVADFAATVTTGRSGSRTPVRTLTHLSLSAAAVLGLGAMIVVAGSPARGVIPSTSEDLSGRLPSDIDPSTFPSITVEQDVLDWNHEISGEGVQEIVLTLVENLQIERQALLDSDPELLEAVAHGDRLDEMQARIVDATASGATVVERYEIDDVNVRLVIPFGEQTGLSLGLESTGTRTTETFDADGDLQSTSTEPFETTFVLGRPFGARWINVAVFPEGTEP